MKLCTKCKIEKTLREFSRKREGWNAHCKDCHRLYVQGHYKKNGELYKQRARRDRAAFQQWYKKLKEQPCMDCGKSYPGFCMEFDHRPGTEKLFSISAAFASKRVGREKILAEIAKCDLVCAICHRYRTHARSMGV